MSTDNPAPRQTPPPLTGAFPQYIHRPDTPDGRPPLTAWRKWTIFFIGLIGGTVFSFFVFTTLGPKWAVEILQTLIGLATVKIILGVAFLIPWRTRMLGLGLLLSIPLTVLVVIVRVLIEMAMST